MSDGYKRTYGHENENGEWVRPVPKPDDEYTYQWNPEWIDEYEEKCLTGEIEMPGVWNLSLDLDVAMKNAFN